jgi:hypothetical protein
VVGQDAAALDERAVIRESIATAERAATRGSTESPTFFSTLGQRGSLAEFSNPKPGRSQPRRVSRPVCSQPPPPWLPQDFKDATKVAAPLPD